MAYLSVLAEDGIIIGCANPIFVISDGGRKKGAELVFEVFDKDAAGLRARLGKFDNYGVNPNQPLFSAKLTSLEPCESTHPGLALLRDRPTLQGILTIEGEIDLIGKPQDS
jgi:hypothetical protein